MPILVRNIRLGLDEPEDRIPDLIARRLRVPVAKIRAYAIVRRALDARRGGGRSTRGRRGTALKPEPSRPEHQINFSYHVEVALEESAEDQRDRLQQLGNVDAVWFEPEPTPGPFDCVSSEPKAGEGGRNADAKARGPTLDTSCEGEQPTARGADRPRLAHRPLIIGLGPAGIFAGLRLAIHGYQPIILERGRDIRRRHRDVLQRFFVERDFDPSSNLLFGEGGAGTYSDGKLYTRVNDPLCRYVLETFFRHGADPDILINTRPHIGSDRLGTICTRIRDEIKSLGGCVRFDSLVDDVRITEDPKTGDPTLAAVHVTAIDAPPEDTGPDEPSAANDRADGWMPVGPMILAIGHSARDTMRMLARRQVRLEPKPFQIGVRIEHPQAMVDRWQYGTAAGHQRLAPAEYHMVAKHAGGEDRDLFSFCMCPGGMILPANESEGLIATNGASRSQRAGPFANSGLVITVEPKDFGNGALEGLTYQQRWERQAFEATGGTFRVPAQRASDFLARRSSDGALETSYPLGARWTDIRALIPEAVAAALERGLPMLDRKYPGFAGTAGVITAPETRASGPVRIVRDPTTRQAVEVANLFPVGEGAGYAGGIVSAAVDGIKTADAIIRSFAPAR